MSLFGRVFGKPPGAGDEEQDETEVEGLLQQISDARHAGDRREAMCQLSNLLRDNPRAQSAIGSMGLPVLLSVLQEDRDDLELLKGALDVLQLSVGLPEAAAGEAAQQQLHRLQHETSPPPALINADLFCRAPDNVLLLLGLLRPEPDGSEDFYVRYSALQALGALLTACPDKLQACVLSCPWGVVALMDLLAQPLEVLRNEALLLLVGLCNGCAQIASIAAFEGAFEKLLAICGAEGGPSAGDVVGQDAAELMNNLLRDNLANQRLFREMGHINQLPPLLQFTPPAPPAASAAAAGLLGSASQFMDPSFRAAAGAAASAAANSAVGAAAAAAAAAAGAAAAVWPVQVSANYLCLLETARLLLAAPHADNDDQRMQEEANRRANQDRLGQLGLMSLLIKLAVPGAPSAAVRAQALFCLGDLVWGHAELQELLAGQLAAPAQPATGLQHIGLAAKAPQPHPIPFLQVVLQLLLYGSDELQRAGASHLLHAFCHSNAVGQLAVLSTVVSSAQPQTFGEELLAALLCQPLFGAQAAAHAPGMNPLDLQLTAGRAAAALGFLLQQNPVGQSQLLELHVNPEGPQGGVAETLMVKVVKLLWEGARRADGKALPVCYNILRLLITWCAGCSAAVAALLSNPSHLPLLVDLVGGRMAAGDAHSAGLAAVLLGVCLMFAPGSPILQQQQQGVMPPVLAAAGGITFDQLLDVLLSRVGLSQFYGAIDDMKASSAFQAAKKAPRLPAHITRGMASALLEAESAAAATAAATAAAAGGKGGAGTALVGGALGLLTSAADAGGPGSPSAAAHGSQPGQHGQEIQPYDQTFTQTAEEVASTVQQLTLNAFSTGASNSSPSPAGFAPLQTPQQLPPSQPPAAPTVIPAPPAGMSVGTPDQQLLQQQQQQQQQLQQQQLQQHQQQQQLLQPPADPSAAALLAQLAGETADQKLHNALQAILQLQGSVDELRSRNRSLAEDLIRVSQSKPSLAAAANGPATANGGPPTANGVHDGASPAAGGDGAAAAAADADARVAAHLRASRAELEAGVLKQQLAAMHERWSALEAEATAAREAAEEAKAAAAKAEADLAALSTAYNDLEAHAFSLEEQAKQQEEQQQQQVQPAGAAAPIGGSGGGGVPEAEVEARIQAAIEQDRLQRGTEAAAAAASASAGAETASDIQAHIDAAAADARAEAEAGEEMEDLLACLGEEQAKVEALASRLTELGEDVERLLAAVQAKEEGEEELL